MIQNDFIYYIIIKRQGDKMKTNLKKVSKSLALIPLLIGSSLFATLEFTPVEDLTIDGNGSAFKTKLVRMGNAC